MILKFQASLILLDTAIRVARESSHHEETQQQTLMSMLFPTGSRPNASPLHVLACNDTCSFTWTGAEHINQVCNIIYSIYNILFYL